MKILVALDGSENGLRAAAYVSRAAHDGWHVTLYHVLEVPAPLREHGGAEKPTREEQVERELEGDLVAWEAARRVELDREIFEPARRLFEHGTQNRALKVQTEVSLDFQGDAALDIIQKVRSEGYDTVAIGRRGRSALKEFVFGGVSFKLVHHLHGAAIWIIE